MSRMLLSAAVAACLMAVPAFADHHGEKKKSDCLAEGDSIDPFYVTKVAGAEDDSVEAGEELCYRCKYGNDPMVMVFTRKTDDKVAKFVRELNGAVKANEGEKLRSFVTLLGDDAKKLEKSGKMFAKEAKAEHVPIVVAKETKTGPKNYKIDKEADVTVVLANDSQVVSSHTFQTDSIDIAAVMKQVKKMLN